MQKVHRRSVQEAMELFTAKYLTGGDMTEPSEPEFKFSHVDGKIQIFSHVHNVKMFPTSAGTTAQNFVAECADEEEANELLDRLRVPKSQRPEHTK
jgi:hypothetical protein